MTPETEERISRQLTTFEELVKHLATKEELQKLRADMILWIIGTNVTIGGVLIGVMLFLNNQLVSQFRFILEHWKP